MAVSMIMSSMTSRDLERST